jgi:hypothetical protein
LPTENYQPLDGTELSVSGEKSLVLVLVVRWVVEQCENWNMTCWNGLHTRIADGRITESF